ncbi:GFA family protein [Afipia clevelandensis]|uniref:GFA family protein n=1 Tax=Afipia clevelandensis TaxID=1034 RepID=UPI00058CEA4D|nr:GFA family protein [Afipia clevelandensis]
MPDTPASRQLAGQCFCGGVHYTVADEFRYAMNCHCSNCRRATGSAFKPIAGIEHHKLAVTKGSECLLIVGDATGHDAHCKTCGSFLYSVVRGGEYVHIAMGSLVDAPAIRPSAHIFVGSKAPWFTITDDLPQYEKHVTA